jgi:hypothetical protein
MFADSSYSASENVEDAAELPVRVAARGLELGLGQRIPLCLVVQGSAAELPQVGEEPHAVPLHRLDIAAALPVMIETVPPGATRRHSSATMASGASR